jgi:hypothetical protein
MKWQQFAILETATAFGLENLKRYDRACCYGEEDANIFERFLTQPGQFYRMKIVLTRWSEDKASRWTEDMWRSSQMKLTPIDSPEGVERELVLRD